MQEVRHPEKLPALLGENREKPALLADCLCGYGTVTGEDRAG